MAINFPIVTTFDDKATKKADKAFGSLGRKFAAVFSVAAVVKFGKASVKAFQDGEKEAAQLRSQLEAINLGFASPLVNEYIDNLALLSGITGRDLTNAFISLSQATEDTTDAQDLLNVALDISAATGKSLQTVSVGLQRAYKGEVTALARLRIGLTTAELKGKDFNEVLEELRERFTGSSARAADTFAGKIARLREAVDLAQEAFGKGLVSGIESSGQSIEDLQQDIIELGETLGSLTAGVNTFANDTIAAFDRIGNSSAVQGLLNVFEALVRGVGFVVTGELVPTMDATTARLAAEERRKNEEANRATLRSRNQLIRAEQKITRIKKEQGKLGDKEKKNALALAKAKAVFDIEKIQIEAALQGKITEEERTRLLLMKAIAEENVDQVKLLTERLTEIQNKTIELAEKLTTFKANDPFVGWDERIKDLSKQIDEMTKKRVMDFLANFTATNTILINQIISGNPFINANANAAAAAAAQAEIDELLGDAEAARARAAQERAEAEAAAAAAAAAIAAAKTEAERIIAEEAARAAKAAADAAAAIEESAAALDAAAASRAASEAARLAAEAEAAAELFAAETAASNAAMAALDSSLLFDESIVSAIAAGVPMTEINVTVEGNVTSAEDLAEVITDIQYNYQRTGKGLLLSSRAI